jgi:hypothetical protein
MMDKRISDKLKPKKAMMEKASDDQLLRSQHGDSAGPSEAERNAIMEYDMRGGKSAKEYAESEKEDDEELNEAGKEEFDSYNKSLEGEDKAQLKGYEKMLDNGDELEPAELEKLRELYEALGE